MRNPLRLLCIAGMTLGLSAGELPPNLQAKFIEILARNANSAGKVHCTSAAVLDELKKLNVAHDAGSKVAWAGSEGEVASLKGAGKMVICGHLEWLPKGGAIALVEEGGKPAIYLHMQNIGASGVTLSDSVLKIGKRM